MGKQLHDGVFFFTRRSEGGAAEGCILLLYDQSLRANVGLSREGSVWVCFFFFVFLFFVLKGDLYVITRFLSVSQFRSFSCFLSGGTI